MNMVTPSDLTPLEISALLRGIGITPPHASLLVHRHRKPSLELAARIERKLGIPCLFWVPEDPEQEAMIDAAFPQDTTASESCEAGKVHQPRETEGA